MKVHTTAGLTCAHGDGPTPSWRIGPVVVSQLSNLIRMSLRISL